MKKIIILLSVLAVFSSCNDWLTVQPKSKILADDLYKTDEGVKRALNGVYINMTNNLYSPEGSMTSVFVENMGNLWTVDEASILEYNLANHLFENTSVDNEITTVYRELYHVINTVNPLIDGMLEHRDALSDKVYHMVLGQAYLIRAYVMFDIIRVWGPSPKAIDRSKKYLPYPFHNTTDLFDFYTYDELIQFVLEDIRQGERLLREYDPVYSFSIAQNPFDEKIETQGDWNYRKRHMNWLGSQAMLARVHLWLEEYDKAKEYADIVINFTSKEGLKVFQLSTSVSYDNYIFYDEHIIGVDKPDWYRSQSGWRTTDAAMGYVLSDGRDLLADLYQNNASDLRYQWQSVNWIAGGEDQTKIMIPNKFLPFDTGGKISTKTNVPLVRLAEMYFIAMYSATVSEANTYYQTYCSARNIPYIPFNDEADRQERLKLEVVREFFAEGHIFFNYKRTGATSMWNSTINFSAAGYTLPLPQAETDFYQ